MAELAASRPTVKHPKPYSRICGEKRAVAPLRLTLPVLDFENHHRSLCCSRMLGNTGII
jgi:hypothetical protein